MSKLLIGQYLNDFARLKQVSGTHRDPTVREKLDTYRFADHKDTVIDLLLRVTRVSVETQAIINAMKTAPR